MWTVINIIIKFKSSLTYVLEMSPAQDHLKFLSSRSTLLQLILCTIVQIRPRIWPAKLHTFFLLFV